MSRKGGWFPPFHTATVVRAKTQDGDAEIPWHYWQNSVLDDWQPLTALHGFGFTDLYEMWQFLLKYPFYDEYKDDQCVSPR
ncbi:MAG TPA: hypothetical protein PKH07_14320 [bacterium]|nr:hypothetical protein [bacterium]